MRFRRALDDLTGRSSSRTTQLLLDQLDSARQGAELAARMCAGTISRVDARAEMTALEREGDSRRAALVGELAAALTTPLDREDLYRFSRSVDDVLDNLRDLVRESDLYDVDLADAADDLLTAVADGVDQLREAVERIPKRPGQVTAAALAARKSAGRLRYQYQLAMAGLLAGEVTDIVLKRRELLRRLDVVGLRLRECADALSDAILKRSH